MTTFLCCWIFCWHPTVKPPVQPVVIAGPVAKQPGYVVFHYRRPR